MLSAERTEIIDPERCDFAGHVEGHLAQEITFFGGHGIDFPAFAVVSEFDAGEMIEMADDEDSGGVKLLESGFGVFDGGLSVHAVCVEEDVLWFDAELDGHAFHAFGFVNRAVAGSTREEKFFHGAVAVKIAGSANAIGQGVGWTAIGIDAGAKDDGDVSRSAVVGFAEEKHLGEGKEGGAGKADGEGGKKPCRVLTRGMQLNVSAARCSPHGAIRHSRGPREENGDKRGANEEREWNGNAGANRTASPKDVEFNCVKCCDEC